MYLIKDDFYNDQHFDWEHATALSVNYRDVISQGVTFPGIYQDEQDLVTLNEINKLIDIPLTYSIAPFFRRYLHSDAQPTFIHTDIQMADYTAVVFMNKCSGGMAFWRHKETGAQAASPLSTKFNPIYDQDTNDVSKWHLFDVVECKPNRLVLFDASLFHSRWPQNSWTSDEDNVRLVKVAFLNKKRS